MDTADKPAPTSGPQRPSQPLSGPGSGGEPNRTEGWLLAFSQALAELSRSTAGSQAGLSRTETGTILRLARDVAHGVERRFAPLAAYLTGRYVAERLQQGATVDEALAEAEAVAQRLI